MVFLFQLQASRDESAGSEDTGSEMLKTTPHLINLNEDNMLSGVIKHVLKEGMAKCIFMLRILKDYITIMPSTKLSICSFSRKLAIFYPCEICKVKKFLYFFQANPLNLLFISWIHTLV